LCPDYPPQLWIRTIPEEEQCPTQGNFLKLILVKEHNVTDNINIFMRIIAVTNLCELK